MVLDNQEAFAHTVAGPVEDDLARMYLSMPSTSRQLKLCAKAAITAFLFRLMLVR